MTKEALKLALEALNDLAAWHDGEVGGHMDEPYAAEVARRTITAIKEALAQPEQKPVAWLHRFIEGGISIGLKPSDLERHPERWEPLYTEPKPCPTCEALARTVMLDQTSHDTTPPQRTLIDAGLLNSDLGMLRTRGTRTWVGLTDDAEIFAISNTMPYANRFEFARAIEAKLKEKNT